MSSSDLAISVSGLGKSYRIDHQRLKHATLREVIMRRLRDPFLRAEHETFWALKDVNFDVKEGEVVGLIGRNGAGKSTLLKVLSRITEPTEGQIDMWGRVGSLLEVGTGFHRELTGRENIFLNGSILGMKRREIERVFDAIVDFAGVEKFLDTPVKRYSSGMYVRLAFAVAAHLEPEILIVDEVLAVGDATFQRKCIGKMNDVAKTGRTVLFVSHNMLAITNLCSRAIWMKDGQVNADGPSADVVADYIKANADAATQSSGMQTVEEDLSLPTQIRQVRVYDVDGNPGVEHDVLNPFTVEIDFVVREPMENVIPCVRVLTEEEQVLMVSTSADRGNFEHLDPQAVFPRKPGEYTARMHFPAPLLNIGRYWLQICLIHPRVKEFHAAPMVPIDITEVRSFASSLWNRPRRGLLALPVRWDVEQQDALREAPVAVGSASKF